MSIDAIGFTPSPLCPTPADRERFLDMHRRLLRTSNVLLVAMAVLLIPGLRVYQPLPAGLALGSVGVGSLLQRLSVRFRRPEVPFALGLVTILVGLSAVVVLGGREHHGDISILIWPVAIAYSRFPKRAAHGIAALAAGLIVGAQLGWDPGAVLVHPLAATAPIAALSAVAIFSTAIRESDERHRREAIVDKLTGLLNRSALRTRVAELQARSQVVGDRVGLILVDLDHFKVVNDQHGHATGDAVLREVAERLRSCLRAYDAIYRLGGEELAVIVPGASEPDLHQLADTLHGAVRERELAGLPITVSLGAALSPAGRQLSWEDLYRSADAALYRAKAEGRDRVVLAAG